MDEVVANSEHLLKNKRRNIASRVESIDGDKYIGYLDAMGEEVCCKEVCCKHFCVT